MKDSQIEAAARAIQGVIYPHAEWEDFYPTDEERRAERGKPGGYVIPEHSQDDFLEAAADALRAATSAD
ncbi:MAG: hypothetical protein AAFR65_10485 [Pseudomonadota bacterium]